MADFKQALAFTLRQEGGYANDPEDSGGETWRGISRKNWPHWDGWQIIDNTKSMMNDFNRDYMFRMLAVSEELQDRVKRFYRTNFWGLNYDAIQNQTIATKLFDWGVNMGVSSAVECLQRAVGDCGVMLDVDGILGHVTVKAANLIHAYELMPYFIAAVKAHYRKVVEDNPKDVKFLKGWLIRADKLPAHSAETASTATS